MESRLGYKLFKMEDPKTFEKMVRDCASKKYNKIFGLYGRTGQKQHGIDIYANDDFQEVIQCKNYTTNDIKALKGAINEDFKSAYNYFYKEKGRQFERFIVATAIDKDKKIDDIIIEHNQQNDIKIEFWFWEDIQDIVLLYYDDLYKKYYESSAMKSVHTDNQAYADSFSETLFLHKHQPESKVNLCNLFVMPKYTEYGNDTPKTDLKEKIIKFLEGNKQFLFIEGDAGCGKSTLVSWLNYNNLKSDDDGTKTDIFNGRPVITVRLRDLDEGILKSTQSLTNAILQHINIYSGDKKESLKNLNDRFPNAVIILDGFDELCMIEGIPDYNKLIYELYKNRRTSYHYIITSRPQYIHRGINIPVERIILQHFDKEKRREWITHYTSSDYCGQTLNDDIKKYIVTIGNDTDSAICDTPMTLYMLAAKNTSIELTKNSWELYNHIFYCALSETEYNQMFVHEDDNYEHYSREYRDIIYRVSEEIAYGMYEKNNNKFYVISDEIKTIIKKLSSTTTELSDASVQKITEQSYSLCNYWKETGDGAVEFYHNNIRDFFLCEKIYRELNEIYNQCNLSQEDKIDKIIEFFLQFKKAPLQDMVCKFILLRAETEVNNQSSFVCKEKTQPLLPYFFEKMLTNGKLYDNLNENKHIQAVVSILSCAAQVYRHIYEPILIETKEKYVKWWNDVDNVNENSDIIRYLFKNIFCHHFFGRYYETILNKAYLSGAYLRDVDLRYADLRAVDLSKVYLRDADLIFANLSNAKLSYADLVFANLRGARLPDGFKSDIQEEQVRHLKEMNIEGLAL